VLSFNIGPIGLPASVLGPLAGFVAALLVGWLVRLFAQRRRSLPARPVIAPGAVVIDMALAGLVAARTGFVIRWSAHYGDSPWRMLDLRDGGFDPWAGVAGVLALAAWRAWRHPGSRAMLAGSLLAGALAWAGTEMLLRDARQALAGLPQTGLVTLDGRPVSVAGFAGGRPVVVNLWASWCPPCVREMPVLEAARQRDASIAYLLVNQGESAAKVRGFLDRQGLAADNVVLDAEGALAREVGSRALPTTLFYDRRGRLVDTHVGGLSEASLAARLHRLREAR
jgi:thiol-disulfide isomerase/thioredoxin